MTSKKVSRVQFSEELKSDLKVQTMCSDVMAIDARKFLVSVLDPLQLTLVTFVKDEGEESLGLALQSHLQMLKERGFWATVVHTDRHATS
jgi:acetyl-CoA carboxylase beta subunit